MPTIRIFKQYIRLPYVFLAGLDGLMMVLCLYAASLVRFGDLGAADVYMGDVLPRALTFALFMLIGMSAMGLYQFKRQEKLSQFCIRLVAALTAGWIGLAVLFYVYPGLYAGRSVLLFSLVAAVGAVCIVRPIFHRVMGFAGMRKRVLVLGAGETAKQIHASVAEIGGGALRITGFLPAKNQPTYVPKADLARANEDRIADYCRSERVEEIVLAADDRRNAFPMSQLLECKLMGIPIIECATFFEREEGRVKLDALYPGWLVFSDGCSQNIFRSTSKRAFDVVTSLCLLIGTLPVMVVAAILIKFEDGWQSPVFYRQQRVGERGKLFDVLKFRSMRVDAEKNGKAQWASERDPRITKIGGFMRKTRIDELPQVFNVLRGEMSFVGPRPERPQFTSELAQVIPYYDERHVVKPGITGWAQIKYPYGASIEDSRSKLEYDLYYVKNHNLMLDLYVMMTTFEVVLFGKGR